MEKRIAQSITYIFHPLLMPFYMMLLIFNLDTFISSVINFEYKLIILGYILLITFVFPVVMAFVFLKMKVIQSLQMATRQERTLPYLSVIIFYYATYYIMKNAEMPKFYLMLFLAITLLTIIAFFINFKFKISIHTLAIGALTGIIIGLSVRLNISMMQFIIYSVRINISMLPVIIILLLVSGFICFARLSLNTHKSTEVYSGYLLGMGFMLLMFFLL